MRDSHDGHLVEVTGTLKSKSPGPSGSRQADGQDSCLHRHGPYRRSVASDRSRAGAAGARSQILRRATNRLQPLNAATPTPTAPGGVVSDQRMLRAIHRTLAALAAAVLIVAPAAAQRFDPGPPRDVAPGVALYHLTISRCSTLLVLFHLAASTRAVTHPASFEPGQRRSPRHRDGRRDRRATPRVRGDQRRILSSQWGPGGSVDARRPAGERRLSSARCSGHPGLAVWNAPDLRASARVDRAPDRAAYLSTGSRSMAWIRREREAS